MVDRRLLIIFLVTVLFVSVLNAERARNDHLQDAEEQQEERDFSADENNDIYEEDVIDTIKRFLGKKKTTTTPRPSSDSLIALFTTKPTTTSSSPTKPSIYDGGFGRKTSRRSTPRYGGYGSTTKSPGKDACGYVSPCKNGGSCKTLSSGRYYCFCTQDYYGKHCENKFISSGSANADRGRTDHCAKSPCRNGGECVGLRTTFYCRCKSPYYGTNCDKRIGKREEIMDESNASEQELEAYERDLAEDTEDLRRAIADENLLENFQ
ncbi:unnamed protein product [Rotaria sordida]|uniref:EGF-like domain-containing protein n=1 Tax=Rotaria sordida TaxID=392033 RepID=A0A814TTM6_9BILA|nr:unnamed protein product [Rotaria sordida]CAF3762499.1 unnamed protein product [Rotaria sordida]